MRTHGSQDGDLVLTDVGQRPKGDRAAAEGAGRVYEAAAAGRPDVLGRDLLRLQRAVGNAGTAELVENAAEEPSPVHDVVGSGGQPLDRDTRADMEARLGHDFGDVRVHTDDRAHRSAASVQAHAYTVGNHVVFQRDAYDPGSAAGRHTIAHELTHVVQQRQGPVDGTPTGGGISVSHPSDRFERDAVAAADQALAEPVVQRQAEEDEEEPAE